MGVGPLGGGDDRLALAMPVAVGDVVGDRVLEEDGLLDHHADLAAEAAAAGRRAGRGRRFGSRPTSTSQNRESRLIMVDLPQPLGPTRATVSPWLDGEVDAPQDRLAAVVAEPDLVEFDGRVVAPRAEPPWACRRPGAGGPSGQQIRSAAAAARWILECTLAIFRTGSGDPAAWRRGRAGPRSPSGWEASWSLKRPRSRKIVAVQDQVRAGEQGDRDGRRCEHLEDRVGEASMVATRTLFLYRLLVSRKNRRSFPTLHGERLDDDDPLEGLLQGSCRYSTCFPANAARPVS